LVPVLMVGSKDKVMVESKESSCPPHLHVHIYPN
jgi:hypothetical protein